MSFDFVVIGAGAAGEAATHYARGRGASVAIVDRDLFGGSCPFWACMPSKTLLHAAEVKAHGGDYPWQKASDRRDYMINRIKTGYPNDGSHVHALEKAGASVFRGTAKLTGPGAVSVTHENTTHELRATNVIVAVGSVGKVPKLDGLEEAGYWTNLEATSLRELPKSIVILGAGPSGIEIAQYLARYGVRTAIVGRVNPTDHPKSSAFLADILRKDGVDVRDTARAARVRPKAGPDGEHVVELSDGTSVSGAVIQLSVGRTSAKALGALGLETVGVSYDGGDTITVDDRLRVAEHVYVIGDPIGHELSTHLGHYEGEMAARIALGDDVTVDFSATPRVVYTDPETAAIGVRLDQARERGIDAFEESTGFPKSTKGYVVEASGGHLAIVVDRKRKTLIGAFIAAEGAGEAIHAAVLAIKLGTPIDTLAQTIHAFPTTARVLSGLFGSAAARLR
ncbi:MAG TPA: NAD(P)/FAD-dependent oxidoreductase [Candidatus Saccharimonadales bacterium]|nr:NAD(P)/FAD-dependent oxidoreductase [Candidatus Saccharimonadales bacterium]